MRPAIGRVVHLPFMPSRGSVGAGMSAGFGTSQFGGDHTAPSGFSVRRNNWPDAQAVADLFCPDLHRRHDLGQAKHVDGQPCRHELRAAVTLVYHMGKKSDDDAAVHRFRIPRPVANGRRDEVVAVSGEERLIGRCNVHGGGTMTDCAMKSRYLILMVRRRLRRLEP
jgi:hypothetical protein